MFSRSQRLSGNEVKTVLMGKTRVLRVPLFMVRVLDRKDGKSSRFAVVVSKKVAKSAVARNLLRRRTYHALLQASLPVGADYVFSLQQSASFADYESEIQKIASQIIL